MKNLALILGSALILSAFAVNGQDKPGSQQKQTKESTHTTSKAPVHKKQSSGNYHMNKKPVKQSNVTTQPAEDNSKVMSKGKPVYK